MSTIGERERFTQDRIVKLFTDERGYTYLGNWEDRANYSNIEEGLLRRYLIDEAYPSRQVATSYAKRQYVVWWMDTIILFERDLKCS